MIIARADKPRANSLHAPALFPRWNEWSIDHAFIGHRLYSVIGVRCTAMNYCRRRPNTKTVTPDYLSYDYADSSQARFSYVMFRHGSTIDRLAAASGHRLPPSRVGITWFACPQRVRNISCFLYSVALPELPERLAARVMAFTVSYESKIDSSFLYLMHDPLKLVNVNVYVCVWNLENLYKLGEA